MKRKIIIDEVLEKISNLQTEIKNKQKELDNLKSRLHLREEKPVPTGFDYKNSILSLFETNLGTELAVKDVVNQLHDKFDFDPDRGIVANRISYLADKEPRKLERVEGRRGFYRLARNIENSS